MKKRFSFNRLLHKDKLMMIVSLILAIIIWVMVGVEQGITYEDEIYEVPVDVKLSAYGKSQGLTLIKGGDITATVKVKGTRAELKDLQTSDITVIADAQDFTDDFESYIPLTAVSKKYEILEIKVENDPEADSTHPGEIWVEAKRYDELEFTLTELNEEQIRLSGLQHGKNIRIDTVVLDDEAVKDGKVELRGPEKQLKTVKNISVDLSDVTVKQTDRFVAALKAYDEKGEPVDGLTFITPGQNEVGVVVRAVVYREEEFAITDIANAPEGFDASMLHLSASKLELGEISGEKTVLDSYVESIRESLTIDFDTWLADEKTVKVVPLETMDGIYLDRVEVPYLTITLDVKDYGKTQKDFDLVLGENVTILCDEGMEATLLQESLTNVILCGPKDLLKKINSDDIRIQIDATGQGIDQPHKVSVRPEILLPDENSDALVWLYYGDSVLELEYSISAIEIAPEDLESVDGEATTETDE